MQLLPKSWLNWQRQWVNDPKVVGSTPEQCQLTVKVASLSKMLHLPLTLQVDGCASTIIALVERRPPPGRGPINVKEALKWAIVTFTLFIIAQ